MRHAKITNRITYWPLTVRRGLPAAGLSVSALLAPHQPAIAQEAEGRTATTLAPITVQAGPLESPTGPVDGYLATRAVTATKTDTPLVETPQSITVVTSEQMADTGAQSIQDALNYAAGVRSEAYGVDSRSDNFRVRGSEPTVYLDGLRTNYNYYTSTTRTEPYTLERIEVLRGPSSMLYGQGSTAGVVNMVSKRPQLEPHAEVGISYGTHNRRQAQADFTGPLNEEGTLLYRLVAVGRKADTQVDYVPDDRWVLAPSITWRPSSQTSFTLLGLWQEDKSGSTSQFFPWEGVSLPNPNGMLPTYRFIGDPDWDRYDSKRRSIGWSLEHGFSDNWKLRHNARWSYNHVDYRSLYADSFTQPGGWFGDPINKRMLGRIAWGSIKTVRMASADQHVEGRFDTGPVRHKLLAGFDLSYAREAESIASDSPTYLGGAVPPIDAYEPVYPAYTPPAFSDTPMMRQRDIGLYLQDELRYGNWIAVAGVRFDRSENMLEGRPEDFTHRATTKRLGVMYAFDNGISPYVSYSESFTPILDRDAAGNAFVPMRGKQWEAGVKYESSDGRLMVNVSTYTLDEENRLTSDPNNPFESIQAGKTRNRGVDVELKTTIGRRFDLIGNYSYINLDEQLEGIPEHQAAVWGKYRFAVGDMDGFSAGAGVRWLSGFTDTGAPYTPSVTLADVMLGYETSDWRFALNVNNLFDKKYVSTCLGRGDCWYGSRRSIVASASYKF